MLRLNKLYFFYIFIKNRLYKVIFSLYYKGIEDNKQNGERKMTKLTKKPREAKGNTRLTIESIIEDSIQIINGKMIDWEETDFRIRTKAGSPSTVTVDKYAFFEMVETEHIVEDSEEVDILDLLLA